MKIVIIGASGTVGRAVTEELSRRHEVIRVGRTQGDHQVDITSQASVRGAVQKRSVRWMRLSPPAEVALRPALNHDRRRVQPGFAG